MSAPVFRPAAALNSALRAWVAILVLGQLSLAGSAVEIVAHRGASHDAPENTLAAFHLAWEQGADAIEGDFRLTKSGRIVCIHDATTERTTGKSHNLNVAQSRMRQLRRLDVGSWKDPRWSQQKIPTLSEVLATVPPGRKIFIEIKSGPEILDALKRVLARASLEAGQMTIISFNEEVIAGVKKQLPTLKAHWLVGFKQDRESGAWSPTFPEILATLQRIGADGLDVSGHPLVTGSAIEQMKKAGYEVHVWTIDDPDEARHWADLGVQSITTNRPRLIRQALENREP